MASPNTDSLAAPVATSKSGPELAQSNGINGHSSPAPPSVSLPKIAEPSDASVAKSVEKSDDTAALNKDAFSANQSVPRRSKTPSVAPDTMDIDATDAPQHIETVVEVAQPTAAATTSAADQLSAPAAPVETAAEDVAIDSPYVEVTADDAIPNGPSAEAPTAEEIAAAAPSAEAAVEELVAQTAVAEVAPADLDTAMPEPADTSAATAQTALSEPASALLPNGSTDAPESKSETAAQTNSTGADSMEIDAVQPQASASQPEASSLEDSKATQETTQVSVDIPAASADALGAKSTIADAPLVESPTGDVPMTDVPGATSSKAGRAREDDEDDEPPAKRVKTSESASPAPAAEPSEPATTTEAPGASGKAEATTVEPAPEAALPSLAAGLDEARAKWADPENDPKPLTPEIGKAIKSALQGVKKTKSGSLFKDPIHVNWPGLWDAYKLRIEKPMDIGSIEKNIREDNYATLGDLKADILLISHNAMVYNGPSHEVFKTSLEFLDSVFSRYTNDVRSIKNKAHKGAKAPTRQVEPRTSQARRESRGAAAAPPPPPPPPPAAAAAATADAPAPAQSTPEPNVYAVPATGVPIPRRASTKDSDSRPKRPIVPTKSRDLEYAKASNRKKAGPETRFMKIVLDELKKGRHHNLNSYFLVPVDPVALKIPNYHSIVKKPMDLSTMTEKYERGEYRTINEFERDFNLIVSNCILYNGPETYVSKCVKGLEDLFKQKMKELPEFMEKNARTPAEEKRAGILSRRGSVAGATPDDDDDDAEEDGDESGEDEADGGDAESETVITLQKALTEVQAKISAMLASKSPNLTLIGIEQTHATAIMAEIVKEKAKAASAKPKSSKAAAKSGKAKAKAAGAGKEPQRKASGTAAGQAKASAAKKSGGAKKAAKPAKIVTPDEKNLIAEAINDLPGPEMNRALNLMKPFMGQAQGDDDEMELDIDRISNEVLLKLLDLVLKHTKHRLPASSLAAAAASSSSAAAAADSPPPAARAAPRAPARKKNKPMTKKEQEEKIQHLQKLKSQLSASGAGNGAGGSGSGGSGGGSQEPIPSIEHDHDESSEDEDEVDSEED